MQIHPELQALRNDDAPQRRAQQALHDAMVAWRAAPAVAAIVDDVARFAEGAELAECLALARLFVAGDASVLDLVHGFTAVGAGALMAHPLAHLPQRHYHDQVLSTLVLARAGQVTLSLAVVDGDSFARLPPARTASFWPGEAWEHVLAGRAQVEIVQNVEPRGLPVQLRREPAEMRPGDVFVRHAAREAAVLRKVAGCLVSLQLQRRHVDAGPAREYDLATGALVHQSAGDPRDSRMELSLAVLGRMGRSDAAPLMASIAREPGSESLRWQALRECLALDTRTGFATLSVIAGDPRDVLSAPAGVLRAQLVEAHPQLLEL
ncbi:MAG: hypothetical protein WCY11_07470 [Novosphingobium sp.]